MLNNTPYQENKLPLAAINAASDDGDSRANNLRPVNYQVINLYSMQIADAKYLCLNLPQKLDISKSQLEFLHKQVIPCTRCFKWQFLVFQKLNSQHCVADISDLLSLSTYDFNYAHPYTIQLLCELLGLCVELVQANYEQWYLPSYIVFKKEYIYYSVSKKTWYFTLLPISCPNKSELVIDSSKRPNCIQNAVDKTLPEQCLLINYQKQIQANLDNMMQFCLQKLSHLLEFNSRQSKLKSLVVIKKSKQENKPNLAKIYELLNSDNWPDVIPYLAQFCKNNL